ncbi:RHS repeat-associated core domain-containing protein [Pseudomonas sichuanensis]|uniref:RHS repeat-associated core domain-containing protein n=1 Tax=Pseudomonas sichuanensis TaxID=2213015 RepID=UPI000DA6A58D|nr:RHS repeat-associated core domain-containing protein [Pseudomonas sichuanensis]
MTYNCHAFRKFFKNGDPITVDGVKAVYEYAEDDVLRISFPDKRSLAYTDIEHVPELDAKLAQEAMQLEAMLESGAVLVKPEEWGKLSPASGAVWVELTTETNGYYSFFGYVTVVGYPGQYAKFVFTVDNALQDHHAQLTLDYPILKGTGLFNGLHWFFKYIKNVYLLSGIVSQIDPYAVPYLITTRSDGYLPDMTDFTLMREGSVDDGWYSTVPIKAGRELARNERLSAFLVNRCDGEISRFTFTPQASELTAQNWPRAFAKYVAEQGAPITAGAWDENNNFTTESGPLRLWSHAKYRAFSNAPFDSNLVQALACNDSFRLAACEPTVFGKGEESPLWVSAGKIIWGGRVKQDYEIVLDYPESLRGEGKLIVGHFGAFDEHAFWKDSKSVEFTPSAALAPYTPRSLLCEDWGNTDHSEIFDTFGHDMTGVDGRLGLFHAHYPIATLQGLGARGPLCDLTLHYSALRGNEAGLGDGWAWRFSSLDVRDRVLTLANGGQITFTPEEWEDLGKQKPLKKKHCLLRCNKDYSEFTIELPNGRQEVLKKPAMEEVNEVEPNDEFRRTILKLLRAIKEKSKPQFPAVPEHWTQWVLLVASPAAYYVGAVLDYNEAAKAWETHGTIAELNERIAYYERPFVQLLPSRIISHYGEVLELTWKRQLGQFLLMRIESEQQPLFTAEYVTPDKSAAQVSMQIWPASDERFEVNLQLNDWLLRTLEWTQAGARLQQVKCGYEDDPVLDRVLCRLEELDGSVEYVRYTPGVRPEPKDTNKWPSWPKVELHALIPGGGQENHVATYQYSGELRDSSDQLYIIAGRRGPYGKRRHHLQVFGEDGRHRREILAGEASAEDQWLELKAQNKNTTHNIRYTGYGNDLIEVIESIKLVIRKGKPALACKHSVKHQQAIVEMLWQFSRNQREVLVNAIQACLQVVPVAQRQPHGKAVDMQITTTDDDGLPVKVIIEGQHTLYRGYYGRAGGANHIEADLLYIVDSLPELQELQELPLLDCPAVPEYAMLPVMYEYECDDFGHPLGLKLFGYRTVAHAGRPYLELAEERVIQGRRLQMEAGELFIPTDEPEQIGLASVLCRRHLHYSSTVTHKATPSDASKVKVWTVKNTQMTLQGPDVFWEETTKTFEDNPNAPYILERITSQTQAGTQQVSVRHFSRHSANWLTQTDSEIEMTRQYDALGRVVDDARYRLEPGRKSRAENQRAVIHITTAYSADNKLETHTHANGAQRRNHLDGVQRVWRSEWQPAGAIDYVPLDEYCRDGLDESQSVGCWEWDYLPGGQAVIEMAQVQPKDGREPWLTALGAVVEEQSSTNPTPPDVDSSEWDVDVALTCSGGDDEEEMLRFLTCLVQLRDTLPDKTCLQTHIDADCVRWRAGDSAMASLARKNGGATVVCEDGADGTWRHRFIQSDLPGRIEGTETTPRGKVPTHDWQTLCGATVASLRADGRWQRVFVDDQGRLLRTCKDHEDVLYRYDALGRLKSRLVHAMKAGEQWQVLSEHNGLGQEIVRTFLHNGAIRFSQRMTWRGDGRLISKANYQDGQLKSTERFVYDVLDRLKGYTCDSDDAAYCPTNASGDAVKAQAFIWDALDNIVTNVTTRFDGTQHTQDFSYDANADPTRMTSVQHGSQSRVLSWSDNGYLVDDGQGHAFSYTGTGQVSRVNDAEGQLLSRYQYDGHQRLVAQYVEQDESIRELRYDGDELIGEIWFDKTCAVTRRTSISAGLAEYEGDQVRWLIDDPQVGIAGQVRDGGLTLAPRLPFGEGALLEGVVSGYNGMRRDPVTGQYPAGNGYRSYDPGIGRYAQPDWLAPFGDGGHNPYQHCPDPVNLHDPSGAIMLSRWGQDRQLREREEQLRGTRNVGLGGKWRGLALSFVLTVLGVGATVFSGGAASMMLFAFLTTMAATSFGLEVAAALTAETNPELSKALGIASMATGVLSTLGFQGVMKASLKLLNATKNLVQRTVRWGGNGLKAVGRGFKRLKSAKLGVTRQSVWLSMREGASRAIAAVKSAPGKLLCKVDDYIKAPAARLEPMPTYGRHGVFGRLKSLWDGPDPLKLTGRSAAFYKWANQSRFVSTLSENMALAIEANILRGTIESSTALAWGNQTSTISARARGSYLSDLNIKEVARAVGQFEIRSTMELSI